MGGKVLPVLWKWNSEFPLHLLSYHESKKKDKMISHIISQFVHPHVTERQPLIWNSSSSQHNSVSPTTTNCPKVVSPLLFLPSSTSSLIFCLFSLTLVKCWCRRKQTIKGQKFKCFSVPPCINPLLSGRQSCLQMHFTGLKSVSQLKPCNI